MKGYVVMNNNPCIFHKKTKGTTPLSRKISTSIESTVVINIERLKTNMYNYYTTMFSFPFLFNLIYYEIESHNPLTFNMFISYWSCIQASCTNPKGLLTPTLYNHIFLSLFLIFYFYMKMSLSFSPSYCITTPFITPPPTQIKN
jgi:hypothetical protein